MLGQARVYGGKRNCFELPYVDVGNVILVFRRKRSLRNRGKWKQSTSGGSCFLTHPLPGGGELPQTGREGSSLKQGGRGAPLKQGRAGTPLKQGGRGAFSSKEGGELLQAEREGGSAPSRESEAPLQQGGRVEQ